ncbi:MAG: hypothetical protein JNM94_08010 [Phycisphaerae bacterium]|nr:hypothetical protein [Phycisphaerae bacterium]
MTRAADEAAAISALPPALRKLVEDEIRAGNGIAEIRRTHPAPPLGVCIMLAGPVRTRPRESDGDIRFFERCGSSHSGEFYDRDRMFFVLEPPKPMPPVDMNAIREELARREREASADRFGLGSLW